MARRSKNKSAPAYIRAFDSGMDLDALNQRLAKIAEAGSAMPRADILAAFKESFTSALDLAKQKFEHGRLDGLETARLIAAVHDDLIITLFNFTQRYVLNTANPTRAERLALCAVGGFGRGEMAPQSDVDLLFLLPDKKGSAHAESLIEYMLYILWDLGLKVGQSVRTIEQSIKLAKEDQTILTALLDQRFLCGDAALAGALHKQFRKDITRGTGRAYIAAKLEERDIRHEREGNSRYVIEPNIKEGKGGLRDLHVLYWIARFLDKDDKISDPQRAQDYVDMGLFNESAATRFVRAADFLWRTRIWLHYETQRPTETLSFDKQVILSRKMGHASGPVEVAVERFMREYFTNAKEVGALTRIACAKLEAQNAIRLPKGLNALLPNSRRNLKNTDLILDRGRLSFADPLSIKNDPTIIMQLFETAGRRNVDIHPDAFAEIDFRRNLMDADFRRDPENSRIFQATLLNAKAPYATLRAMNEAGVLGRYLIEFGGIVARTQFNMHHAFTVDEHTLRLVDNFDNMRKELLKDENPVATKVAKAFNQEQVLTMMLTCLLHDTGKGVGDQCIEGAQLTRRACRRLGVSPEITDTAAWLVRSHLEMSETAQRRDISDPETIAKFAAIVGSQENLDLLFALTVVDIRSVGPGIWNDWKGVLLRELYAATTNYLEGRTDLAPAARASSIQEQMFDKLRADMGARIKPITKDLPHQYWLNFDMAGLLRHARFFDSVMQSGERIAVQSRLDTNRNVTELWILTQDRVRLFADVTKAISSCGASISGAHLHTAETGRVMNVFYLHAGDGGAYGADSPHLIETLRARTLAAAHGKSEDLTIPKALKSSRSNAIPVKPKVKFLDTASGGQTIIEIKGRDKPGLLYGLAQFMSAEELDVFSAHIEVVGAEAVDAFYVRSRTGDGSLSEARRKALKTGFLEILNSGVTAKSAA